MSSISQDPGSMPRHEKRKPLILQFSWEWWHMPTVSAPWETEVKELQIRSQPRATFFKFYIIFNFILDTGSHYGTQARFELIR